MAKSKKSGMGRWVTINGTHVLIENGKITKGPSKFVGLKAEDIDKSDVNKSSKYKKDTFFNSGMRRDTDREIKETAKYYKKMGKSKKDIDPIDRESLTGVELDYFGNSRDFITNRRLSTKEMNTRADYVDFQLDRAFNSGKGSKKTTTKYPSGITTTAQKRAYTRALNSGMPQSLAKKYASKY